MEIASRRREMRIQRNRDHVGPREDLLAILGRNAEQIRDRLERHIASHVGHEVDSAHFERAFDQPRGDRSELVLERVDCPQREHAIGDRPIVSMPGPVHGHHGRFAAALCDRGIKPAHGSARLVGEPLSVSDDRHDVGIASHHPNPVNEQGLVLERLPITGPLIAQLGEQIERQPRLPGVALRIQIRVENAEIAHFAALPSAARPSYPAGHQGTAGRRSARALTAVLAETTQ